MEIKLDQIPPHKPTLEETETLESIKALLKNGWEIIKGNEWINTPQGGHFLIKVQKDGQLRTFESKMSRPSTIGPDGLIR